VGGHSPALWRTGGERAPDAFDDAEDFASHDVVGTARANLAAFGTTRLWIDGGDTDTFRPGIDAFTAALRDNRVRISAHRWPGGHEGGYWSEHWRDYARFYAGALARC
jgi:hypothetical protein